LGNYSQLTMDQIFAQAAAQGISIFASAGDTGSDDCAHAIGRPSGLPPSVDAPASDQYVLGVGGTALTLGGGSKYGSETTWNNAPSQLAGGGGGLSSYFSQPSWQIGAGADGNGHNGSFPTGLREVPDLAADADPNTGYSIYCTSLADCSFDGTNVLGWWVFGGTSASAPLWASLLTDVNTYLVAQSVSATHWANVTIYQLFDHPQTHTPFHDVTSGTNDVDYGGTAYAGDYPSTACYDLTTGVGSPDAWNIAQDLQAGVNTTTSGPCTAPASNYTDLVADGGFEQPPNTSPWSQFSFGGFPVLQQGSVVHTGKAAFFPCGYPACDDRVWQTITVPATVHSATLRYWLSSFSPLGSVSPAAPCLDHFYVTLAALDGTVASSIPAKCETEAVYGYTFETVDLTSLLQANAGQQLVLMLRGTTANEQGSPGINTFWGVDDVALLVS
jgi:kumamolisin